MISAFCVLGILGGCLVFEWHHFYIQAEALCDIKEDYNRYVAAIKKIMNDYNKTKERLELLESYLENEKKNEIADGVMFHNDVVEDEFVLLNRDITHLRQSAHAFIAREYNADFLSTLGEDEWMEYADYLDKTLHPEQIKLEKKVSKKLRNRTIKKKCQNGVALPSDMLFAWPVERSKCWISSLFGPRPKANGSSGFHYGLDMAAFCGTPVKAVSAGIVLEARYARAYGKTILISHNRKYKTRYAHLHKIHVGVGQKVSRGQVIGLVGSTGNVRTVGKDGSHLHFEVYCFNRRVNPLYFLMD